MTFASSSRQCRPRRETGRAGRQVLDAQVEDVRLAVDVLEQRGRLVAGPERGRGQADHVDEDHGLGDDVEAVHDDPRAIGVGEAVERQTEGLQLVDERVVNHDGQRGGDDRQPVPVGHHRRDHREDTAKCDSGNPLSALM